MSLQSSAVVGKQPNDTMTVTRTILSDAKKYPAASQAHKTEFDDYTITESSAARKLLRVIS